MIRSAEEMAKQLINIYERTHKKFLLSQDDFKAIAGKERLKDAYLWSVDEQLREDGYLLFDLRPENGTIGVIRIKTVKKWMRIDDIDDYIPGDWEEED